METSAFSAKDFAQSGEHYVYEWQGSAYEIGRQHGLTLRDEILREFSPALESAAGVLGWSEARVLDRHRTLYEPVFQELVPRAVEEIRGLAHGAQLSYEQAFFAATRDGARLPRPSMSGEGCTAFFCGSNTARDGHVLLGQTKDTGSSLSRYRILKLRYDDGLRVVSLNYPGWIAHVGLSSNGLANTGNSLYADAPSEDTVPFSLLKRLVLESSSIEDVLAVTARLRFENACILIGSAGGEGTCIELVAGRRAVFDISRQAFGHANSILAPALQACEIRSEKSSGDMASSACRQRTVQRRLDENRGSLDAQALKSLISDHDGYPHSICRHGGPGESSTTAAFIADLTAGKVHLCIGNPCAAPFREHSL